MGKIDDGGPAFPETPLTGGHPGMSLRDWFAGHMAADDRLVAAVRGLDDRALAYFAIYGVEPRDGWEAEVDEASDYLKLPSQLEKVLHRLKLEAQALSRARYMQADAMLEARKETNQCK